MQSSDIIFKEHKKLLNERDYYSNKFRSLYDKINEMEIEIMRRLKADHEYIKLVNYHIKYINKYNKVCDKIEDLIFNNKEAFNIRFDMLFNDQ